MQSFIEEPSQIASQGIGPQIINLKDAIKVEEKNLKLVAYTQFLDLVKTEQNHFLSIS